MLSYRYNSVHEAASCLIGVIIAIEKQDVEAVALPCRVEVLLNPSMAKKSLEKWLLLLMFLLKKEGSSLRCDRRPYGSTTQASPSDGRYQLNVLGADDTYLPEQAYTVQLTRTDDESEFIAFVVSAEAELKQDPRNPRRLVAQNPGELRPQATGKYSDRCLYSVEQSSYNTKSSVELYWKAPATGRGCVTLRAMVAESQEIWFEDGAPLTVKLCEDMRQPDDVSPNINYECKVCDEAKYEVTFEGSWSRNIHPRLYPESDWLPRFSDLVGASHAADYVLWAPGNLASDGLKDLAEHANTSTLEAEIREKKMENPTRAVFRTDNTNHLITVAIALYPSPDWFLGVTRFELCEEDNTWLKEREINLYPWDAGTDSGISYESANIETFPQDAVSRVQISSYDKNSPFYEMDMKDLRPFGRLHIKLIRTYPRECEESSEEEGGAPEVEEKKPEDNGSQEPDEPSRYQYPDIASDGRSSETPLEVDPNATEECPLTPWGEWSRCEGMCENGQLVGYKWRERFHLVDGIAVEKYDPNCEESCAENEDNVEVVASGAEKENEKKGRQPRILNPGVLRVSVVDDNTKEGCNNSIIQNHIMPKTSVQVTWEAPPKGNGCVMLHAYVAIKMEVYYNNQGPLTKRICEDQRKPEDMLPKVNADCQVCEDAKYKIVGASHNKDYTIFKSNEEANDGVKMLAEQGNTTRLEMDMQDKIGQSIRSIIKTNRPATTNSTITAMFRVTKEYHLVSLVTAILPSPDWFLGASHMELCSANDEMLPPVPIRQATIRNVPKVKPFARIKFELIRIYHLTPNCFEKPTEEDENNDQNGEEEADSDDSGDETEETGPTEDREDSSQTTTTTTMAGLVAGSDDIPPECLDQDQDIEICEEDCVETTAFLYIMLVKKPQPTSYSKWIGKTLKTVFILEALGIAVSYGVYFKLNTERDFRLYMRQNYNWVLEGYYVLGEKIADHKTRELDHKVWSSEGKI
ncbi:hypothetical protein MSG28_006503 [Choristoneura fumiferana]|uniref:Uncharacterized protein n=1 Tax=Choristoneura fumiferana TaxID=7141 RepID=A0ACC0JFB6_CHOFU|nr:hypothetical protein MSG28_006503 [Choristoneura fumiferana]